MKIRRRKNKTNAIGSTLDEVQRLCIGNYLRKNNSFLIYRQTYYFTFNILPYQHSRQHNTW